MAEYIGQPGQGAALEDKQKIERPRRYKVMLLNDDYTTMEFVVEVLQGIFRRSEEEAMAIMLNVHKNGMGVAGVYVKSIAETKVVQVHKLAQSMEYPLRCTMERE
ncbi:MAG: ATP-dependent Clp protease adapter ClpS [Candidatus Hydrogenedentes bacterium]|nr:ATP-dependent Clp protease adapter ClpS [Candidatus Hydrogenedentota bacterium]